MMKLHVSRAEAITASYELYYSDGGHSGPYNGIDAAIHRACKLLRGQPRPLAIHIIDRRQPSNDPMYATLTVRIKDDRIFIGSDRREDIRAFNRCTAGDVVNLDGEDFVVTRLVHCSDVFGSVYMNALRLRDGQPMRLDDLAEVVRESIGDGAD